MDGAFHSPRRRRRPVINITSLIDVMFLLLIFFMVSSTFRETLGIEVMLPQATTASEVDSGTHEIVVTAEEIYFVGEQRVDRAGLEAAVRAILADEPEATLVLRADEAASFGAVVDVFDLARRLGATDLVLPTRVPSGAPN